MTELTDKQHRFVTELVSNGFNAQAAAIKAGYSKTFAHIQSHDLVNNPKIKNQIDQAFQKVQPKVCISLEYRIKKLLRIVEEFIPDSGKLLSRQANVGLKALAEINKMQGDYAASKSISVNVEATQEKLKELEKIYKEY